MVLRCEQQMEKEPFKMFKMLREHHHLYLDILNGKSTFDSTRLFFWIAFIKIYQLFQQTTFYNHMSVYLQ